MSERTQRERAQAEQLQVPPADFQSYYGRPILKVSRWKEPHLPAYLFLGELSGALALVGAVAHATGRRSLTRTARVLAKLMKRRVIANKCEASQITRWLRRGLLSRQHKVMSR